MPDSNFPSPEFGLTEYNQKAWDAQVKNKSQWTVPVDSSVIEAARNGDWSIILTPEKKVPREWFPDFQASDIEVLCLAGGGGQQGPILAAAGAKVTVFDLSEGQLGQDRLVADREDLEIKTVQGSMTDLSTFESESFDLIVHPCSNGFVEDVQPVWNEAARVLKTGGSIISGFTKPVFYIFDYDKLEKGELAVEHSIPYSDLTSITAEERKTFIEQEEPLCFGHSLTQQIGGQITAGLAITGYFEDIWSDYVISKFIPAFAATKATKMVL